MNNIECYKMHASDVAEQNCKHQKNGQIVKINKSGT